MDLKSNEPFWLIKNGLMSSYPSLKTDENCDVLIIGAGITGSLLAHQMVADGYRTILIDRREICNGSTSATTSMLQYEIDVPLHKLKKLIGRKGAEMAYRACSDSIDRLEKISKQIKSKAGFTKKESLYFAAFKKDVAWLEEELAARKSAGFRVKWLSAAEVKKKYGIENTFGGILSEQGASVDAFHLAHEILAFNQKKGLKIFDKTELKSARSVKNRVLAETTSGKIIRAKKIIYCNGYESTELIKEYFVKLKSTFAMVSEIDKKNIAKLSKTLAWNTADPYLYMRTTDDGRLLVGGADEDFKNPEKRDKLIPSKNKALTSQLKKILPKYQFYTDFAWAGTFGETKDGLPYIGEHKDFPNSYFVLGFGGNGITFSVAGMELASLFMAGKIHPLEEFFRFGR